MIEGRTMAPRLLRNKSWCPNAASAAGSARETTRVTPAAGFGFGDSTTWCPRNLPRCLAGGVNGHTGEEQQ
jgi:hypothetical protein